MCEKSYMLAGRRITSVCQQSDQLLSSGGKKITASPTILCQGEKVRMKTVQEVKEQLGACSFLLLCYDGRLVNHSDPYVFVGLLLDGKLGKSEAVIAVKIFFTLYICHE